MLALIIFIIQLVLPKTAQTNENNQAQTSEQTTDNTTEEPVSREEEVKDLTENARIKRYIGYFLEDIENGDYQSAYNVLNEDFKSTYFPTLENFTTYAKKYFDSPLLSMTYDNIERLGNEKTGNMYVVWTTISNMFMRKLKDGEKIAQTNFVIIEKNYNDYEMSFSVNDQ